jgi:shikimate dehydrogenase
MRLVEDRVGDSNDPQVVFIGASASMSRANLYFAGWAGVVGLAGTLIALDVAPDQGAGEYERLVGQLLVPEVVGGVVTNHKVGLFREFRCRDWQVSDTATALEVVSCFRTAPGGFEGNAEEPLAIERAIREISAVNGAGPYRELLIFGAGGAGRAIAYAASRMSEFGLARINITDTRMNRVEDVRRLSRDWGAEVNVELALNREVNNAMLKNAQPGCLVVNATGLGKDLRGSPLSSDSVFPMGSSAWDLNYRGGLDFLHHARTQSGGRGVRVFDGQTLFTAGWMEAMTYIARTHASDDVFARFQALAVW